MKKPLHSKVMHAFADGAKVQVRVHGDWLPTKNPVWNDKPYRIDPSCDYAIELIPLHLVTLYNGWLKGRVLEVGFGDVFNDFVTLNNCEDPLYTFLYNSGRALRFKKIMKVQVLWVLISDGGNALATKWVDVDSGTFLGEDWHKLPNKTQEVEVK